MLFYTFLTHDVYPFIYNKRCFKRSTSPHDKQHAFLVDVSQHFQQVLSVRESEAKEKQKRVSYANRVASRMYEDEPESTRRSRNKESIIHRSSQQ